MNPVAETQQSVDALPVFQAPATLGDVWNSNWDAAGLSTPIGVGAPKREAVKELYDAYTSATGQSPFAAAAAAGHPMNLPAIGPDGQLTGMLGADETHELTGVVGQLTAALPQAQRDQVAPFLDVDGRAAAKAQKLEQDAAAVNQRAYGLSGVGTSYVAGLARGLADPTTAIGAFAGGPEASALLPMLTREFAVNAGFGAATHEIVAPQREQLGLESGSLVGDALESGVFGAGLGLLLRGAGWTLRQAMARRDTGVPPPEGFRPNPNPPPDLHAEAGAMAPEDFEAAARLQDRETAIDAAAPVQTMPGRIEAREATDAAAARIESGEGAPLEGEILEPDRGAIRTPDGFVTIPDHPMFMQTALDDAVQSGWITAEEAERYAADRRANQAAVVSDEEKHRAELGEPTGSPEAAPEQPNPSPVKPLDEAAAGAPNEPTDTATARDATAGEATAAAKPLADPVPGEGLAPQRADVERALEAAGGDAKIQSAEGEASAREQLSAVDEFKAAAKELAACILKFGNGE